MHPRVLLEVNVAGEGSKFGFKPETVRAEMESLLALPRLSIEGLMIIPPVAEEPDLVVGVDVEAGLVEAEAEVPDAGEGVRG